jgi:hypothetical protein
MSVRLAVRTSCTAAILASLSLAAAGGCTAEPLEEEGPDAAPAESASELGAGPLDFQSMAPCYSKKDYVARAVVRFSPWQPGFTPRCLRLATGGTVVFQGSMDQHPLIPRDEGATSSPIQATYSGGSVEFEFNDFGFFPYRCAAHPEEIGVVWASYAF